MADFTPTARTAMAKSPFQAGGVPAGAGGGAVCVVLAAGFSQIERDLELIGDDLAGIPKALLPVAGRPMLDHWWDYLSKNRAISEIFVVTNAVKYKHFERWATARGLGVGHVVNSGATSADRSRGVLRDVQLGLKRAEQMLGSSSLWARDVVVLAGDTLFFKDFDLERILAFQAFKGGSLLLYYGRRREDRPAERGMCEVDPDTSQVVAFAEKPCEGLRGHDFQFVSPLFYILEPAAWQRIEGFNDSLLLAKEADRSKAAASFSFGRFVEHAVETLRLPFWGMRMPGAFFLIGSSACLEEYRQLDLCFNGTVDSDLPGEKRHIVQKTYARVGLMGNPSDGFHGKTIAVTVRNFWASVELWESEQLTLLPHPLYDPSSFSGLADLHFIGRREGYYGGTRLLMATCKRFQELCTNCGIALPRKNFTAKYDTNIPRQVGLAGSSAIVTSLFKALMEFYDLTTEHVPLVKQPSFVLSVESELGIQAGLQDRVVQVFEGLVFMDFEEAFMAEHGHGRYERMSQESFEWVASLPLFIAYESDPSDSGKIHSNVRQRWEAKDPEVLEGMKHFADLAVRAREAIEQRNADVLADCMDENFATRRKIYGDSCLGTKNLRMVEICRSRGAAAKFPGSGGAVLGLCRPLVAGAASADGSGGAPVASPMDVVRLALEAENFVFTPLDPVTKAAHPSPSSLGRRPSASRP